MISTYLLLDDIRNHLKAEFSGVHFREPVDDGKPLTPEGEAKYCEPRFYVGQLPPKRTGTLPEGEEQGEDVPFVLVKCLGGQVTGEQKREYQVDVGIVFSVFVPENNPEAGLQDLMNIADRVAVALCFRRYWANNAFFQEPPIKMVQGTGRVDSPYLSGMQVQGPYYMGAITTQFKAAALPQKPPKNIVDQGEPAHPAF